MTLDQKANAFTCLMKKNHICYVRFQYSSKYTMRSFDNQLWYYVELCDKLKAVHGVLTYDIDKYIVAIPISKETLEKLNIKQSQVHSICLPVVDASYIIVESIETKYTLDNDMYHYLYIKSFDIKDMCFEELQIKYDLEQMTNDNDCI